MEKVKTNSKQVYTFIKRLSLVLSALAILGLGVYAVYLGLDKFTNEVGRVAIVVSGCTAVLDGLVLTYKALMKE